jgi:hypothetical protein
MTFSSTPWLASVLLISSIGTAIAAAPELDPLTIPGRVLDVAQQYQNAIGCSNIDKAKQPVIALTPYTDNAHRDEARYAVLWSGDIACAGGSGTSTANITIVGIGGGNGFFVLPAQSSPQITFDSPVPLIREVVTYTQDTLTLRGKEHAEGDPHCCPTIDVRFTLREDPQGNWLLTEKYSEPKKQTPK